jgi:hypothetical protein
MVCTSGTMQRAIKTLMLIMYAINRAVNINNGARAPQHLSFEVHRTMVYEETRVEVDPVHRSHLART